MERCKKLNKTAQTGALACRYCAALQKAMLSRPRDGSQTGPSDWLTGHWACP